MLTGSVPAMEYLWDKFNSNYEYMKRFTYYYYSEYCFNIFTEIMLKNLCHVILIFVANVC